MYTATPAWAFRGQGWERFVVTLEYTYGSKGGFAFTKERIDSSLKSIFEGPFHGHFLLSSLGHHCSVSDFEQLKDKELSVLINSFLKCIHRSSPGHTCTA